jgi:hypothetical protein
MNYLLSPWYLEVLVGSSLSKYTLGRILAIDYVRERVLVRFQGGGLLELSNLSAWGLRFTNEEPYV